METKKKSRFPKVLLAVVIVLGITFTFAANKMRDRYRVLDNASKEVSSMLPKIKDYRKLKGYKVIRDESDYKIILISAGLTYGKNDNLVVKNVDFESGKVRIIVEENIEENPAVETIMYPYLMLKVDTVKDDIEVLNTDGELYSEIALHDPTAGIPEVQETNNEEVENELDEENVENSNEDEDKKEEEKEEVSSKEDSEEIEVEDEEVKDESKNIKYVTGEYQGRIDGGSIEVKVGNNDYFTFDISDIASSFKNYDYGTKLKIGYIEKNGSNILISVNE